MSKKLERFGKYLILDHLVDGGMAKICRARFLGEQGNKVVAIKMVQAQFSKDPSFVQMFEDELKVTFGLVHPNIAQVFDYGMVNGQLYSAMEYVDGANLKQYLDRLKAKNFVFPVEISTYIISQTCQALHYAHTFQDRLSGKLYNIIHRDISPHNIMLTYDGTLKLIDFGIAKADSNSEATQAGTIKGKLSYLAPEYLDGLELDHRYDQFAIGITLWEMLCSRKLFKAKNDLAVLKQIQACKIPKPSSINPNVPKELDEIVLKALSPNRDDRYENMDKLNRALIKFLYSKYPDFNATDLGFFAKQLFKEEIEKDKVKFVEFGKINIGPYISDMNEAQSVGNSTVNSQEPVISKVEKIELEFDDLGIQTSTEKISLDISDLTGTNITRSKFQAINSTKQTSVTGIKNRTSKQKKKNNKKSSRLVSTLIVASLVGFTLFHFDNEAPVPQVTGKKPASITAIDHIDTSDDLKGFNIEGKIDFIGLDAKTKVYLNGKEIKIQGISAIVSYGVEYKVLVKKQGFKIYKVGTPIILTESDPFYTVKIPKLEKEGSGFISSSMNYAAGSKIEYKIDGVKVVKKLPLKNERFPAGSYDAIIKNPLLGTERKVHFIIEENKRNFLK